MHFKGTVSMLWSDPPCKDINARFTTVPLKPLSLFFWQEKQEKHKSQENTNEIKPFK